MGRGKNNLGRQEKSEKPKRQEGWDERRITRVDRKVGGA
jgi:hypothetical protein